MPNDAPDPVPVPAPPAETLRKIAENIGYDRGRRRWSDDGSGTGEVNVDHEKLTLLILGAMWQALRAEPSPAPPAVPPELPKGHSMNLAYERVDSEALMQAIRLEKDEHLLVLQPFGWHLDGHHIPNAAEQFSREGVCDDHGWQVVLEMGEYIAIVRAAERAAPSQDVELAPHDFVLPSQIHDYVGGDTYGERVCRRCKVEEHMHEAEWRDGKCEAGEAAPRSPAREWQPIETAPKDGTSVLLLVNYAFSVVGCWQRDWWTVSWGADALDEPPTHWMPLPDPPSSSSETKT